MIDFDGPLDLLLSLVNEKKLEITDINLASITNRYIEEISKMNLEDLSNFIVIASALIEIKSRLLLPCNDELVDYKEDDPTTNLVEKLKLYKKFKEIAKELKETEGANESFFYRDREEIILPKEEFFVEKELLVNALLKVIDRLQRFDDNRQEFFKKIHRDVYTVDAKVKFIRRILGTTETIQFSSLFTFESDRIEIITTFLALLELMKSGEISIFQTEDLGEINIRRKN